MSLSSTQRSPSLKFAAGSLGESFHCTCYHRAGKSDPISDSTSGSLQLAFHGRTGGKEEKGKSLSQPQGLLTFVFLSFSDVKQILHLFFLGYSVKAFCHLQRLGRDVYVHRSLYGHILMNDGMLRIRR